MERIFQDVGAEDENRIMSIEDRFNRMEQVVHDHNEEIERRFASVEERFSGTEEAVNNLQTQVSALNTAVERALSSPLPKVESLLRGDASAKVSGTASSSPSTSSSCQRTLSSHSQGEPLQKAHTTAQRKRKSTTPMSEASSVSNPRVTSVSEVAAAGDAVALRRILANGGNVNNRDANGVPALHLAAAKGHVEAVGALLDGRARLNLRDPEKRIALHIATAEGRMDVVGRLLEAGSKVEVKDAQGNTPFMVAVNAKHWQIVHLLVEKGADPNATVFEGKCALRVAAEEGEIETVKVMLRNKKPNDVRVALSYAKNKSVVLAFEEALPGIIMEKGGCAMITAAQSGRLESMVALLDAGFDIECNEQFLSTAFQLASSKGRVECVNELVRWEVDINGADSVYERTALHAAAMNGHEDVVRVLLDAGADATMKDNEGKTALHAASMEGHEDVVRVLLDAGADATMKDNEGKTALHWASKEGHEDVVLVLLEEGADANIMQILDNEGETALECAKTDAIRNIISWHLQHLG